MSENLDSKKSSIHHQNQFTEEERKRIQTVLDTSIDHESIQFRPSAQGHVAYVEGWKALSLANEVFGFSGWSSEILSLTPDFQEVTVDGRISIGISCMVRVSLKDGTFHDDIGWGSAENQKSKAAAWEKARKEAVTDAMKRALRMFGNRLGNCAYDKSYLKQVKDSRVGGINGNGKNYGNPNNYSNTNNNGNYGNYGNNGNTGNYGNYGPNNKTVTNNGSTTVTSRPVTAMPIATTAIATAAPVTAMTTATTFPTNPLASTKPTITTTTAPTNDQSVRLNEQTPPADFAPTWKHPKSAFVTTPSEEADSEPVVTEERK